MAKIFLRRGDFYSQTEGNFEVSPTLDDGIYTIHQHPMNGEITLERIADEFTFGFKLYGIDDNLVNHVIDTYNRQPTKRNLGVLLNGAKGTGKTVTAKVLANKLGLPVIICDQPYVGLNKYLAGIQHDCIFFFDEFEKNFRLKGEDDEDWTGEDLLSIMDGVYNSNYCHIFILTTNELSINDNLICRPSRIRYLKSFDNVIDYKILEEFIDDNLQYPEFKQEVMEFIDTLSIATIDIVKSIVEEVNIHHCHISEFKQFFNVKESSYTYYVKYWLCNKFDNHVPSKWEFITKANTPYVPDGNDEFTPYNDIITLNKNIYKLKIGDTFGKKRWKVTEIDLDNNFVACDDKMAFNPSEKYYFYITNIDAKPSLYNDRDNQ